jgi:hypothetical protein
MIKLQELHSNYLGTRIISHQRIQLQIVQDFHLENIKIDIYFPFFYNKFT